jgi:hypothetical protein
MNWSDTVAAQVHAPTATIVFRYRPRSLYAGILCALVTVAGIVFAVRCARSRRLTASSRRG